MLGLGEESHEAPAVEAPAGVGGGGALRGADSANRVLPTPPTPVSVTSRSFATSPTTRSTSSERPISSVNRIGRFVGTTPTDRNGENDANSTMPHPLVASTSRAAPRHKAGPRSDLRGG